MTVMRTFLALGPGTPLKWQNTHPLQVPQRTFLLSWSLVVLPLGCTMSSPRLRPPLRPLPCPPMNPKSPPPKM
uniref:Uncharacterized protein n=1 Tax=Hippocampus comes TaxID=109280 RepID=A0A3Q2YNS2_HIPCM